MGRRRRQRGREGACESRPRHPTVVVFTTLIMGDPNRRLSDNVGFATVKESLPTSAANLMDYTRDTLRRAKEIAATLEEADKMAEEAWNRAEDIIRETKEFPGVEDVSEEDRPGDLEAALIQQQTPGGAAAGRLLGSPKEDRKGEKEKHGGVEQTAGSGVGGAISPTNWGQNHKEGREGRVLAEEMREQITGSVMWVQQLLELVNTAESNTSFHPGESLKKTNSAPLFGDAEETHQEGDESAEAKDSEKQIVPKLKEMALLRSQEKYQEKKADEKEVEDDLSSFFRNSALSQVAKAAAGRRGSAEKEAE